MVYEDLPDFSEDQQTKLEDLKTCLVLKLSKIAMDGHEEAVEARLMNEAMNEFHSTASALGIDEYTIQDVINEVEDEFDPKQ